ncbi:MAG TPA: c-type cytochrome [Candidatus Acidoferrum sp.]|nr:c-type cytochrome [Candidatus Acidoferrum sp.]
MKTFATAISVSACLLALSVALAKPRESGKQSSGATHNFDPAVYAELQKAPGKARAKQNPLANDPEAAVAGGILFEQHCADCHGEKAGGAKRGPSLRVEQVQNAEPGAIFWLLTNGVVRKGMPVWSKLPEPQRWQLVSFIKSLSASAAKTETEQADPETALAAQSKPQ